LKNTRLLRCAHHLSLRRTQKYASFLMMSRALHPGIFEQPSQAFSCNRIGKFF
jgi:hypothetical protein